MAEPASWKRFSVVLAGKTNGAHESVLKLFKSSGQKKAKSPGDADYCLVFCPVVSRVGTDVSEALQRLPDDKEAVLVVMHHTFNPELVVPPSSSLVDDQRVRLTLDCLFHRDQVLHCGFNDHMKTNIKKFFKKKFRLRPWIPKCLAPSDEIKGSYKESRKAQRMIVSSDETRKDRDAVSE